MLQRGIIPTFVPLLGGVAQAQLHLVGNYGRWFTRFLSIGSIIRVGAHR
jgi:hypothetical protein